MLQLVAVELDDDAAFRSISTSRRSKIDRYLLQAVEPSVLSAYAGYVKGSGYAKKLASLEVDKDTRAALLRNYNSLSSDGSHRELRGRIMALTRNTRCPYCRRVDVVTLDHYLPKEAWPEFSVFSKNLIPVCMECNWKKLNKVGAGLDRFIHPYFDALPIVRVLSADIFAADGIAVTYRLEYSEPVSEELFKAWSYHFTELGLASAYEADAVEELAVLAEAVRILSEVDDPTASIVQHVTVQHLSLDGALGINHWRSALYKAIVDAIHSPRRDDFLVALDSFC
ncbi:HNH endonuclease [Micromonospora echinospora]